MCARCAKCCRALFPGATFSFPPPDIISQILNFGTPAPLDVQVTGTNHDATEAFAYALLRQIRHIPASSMPACSSPATMPQLNFDADRARMAQLGLTERDVTNALATALAGTVADRAQLLAQPQERRLLRHGGPDAGI